MKFRDEDRILHAVEIDRTQKMVVNDEKLKCYEEFTKIYKQNIKEKCQLSISSPLQNIEKRSWSNWRKI